MHVKAHAEEETGVSKTEDRTARCALVPERQGREGRGRGGSASISGVLAGYQMLPLEKAEL